MKFKFGWYLEAFAHIHTQLEEMSVGSFDHLNIWNLQFIVSALAGIWYDFIWDTFLFTSFIFWKEEENFWVLNTLYLLHIHIHHHRLHHLHIQFYPESILINFNFLVGRKENTVFWFVTWIWVAPYSLSGVE